MSEPEFTALSFDEPDWGIDLTDADVAFIDNPGPRCPCVLLLDTSSSMAGAPLEAVQAGLRAFRDALLNDPVARQRLEVAVVTFGGPVEVVQPFTALDGFVPPALAPRGQTPLGTGLLRALDLLEDRKAHYRAAHLSYSRPWIFLLTDGMPQGEPWEATREAIRRVKADEAAKKVALFAVGVEGANMPFLARLCQRPPLALPGLRFVDLFLWLSASVAGLARAAAGEQLELPPPGWGPDGAASPS
jgi:uncharacterized protein YegL